MIGDRPDTDILGAQLIGIQTALVRTGRFAPGDVLPDTMSAPDWDVETLGQLKKLLGL
jgi:ribonucleotide monophosphatase NagD (HAD superfamily)